MQATDTSFMTLASAEKVTRLFGNKIIIAQEARTIPPDFAFLIQLNIFAAADNSNVTSNKVTRPPKTVAVLIIKPCFDKGDKTGIIWMKLIAGMFWNKKSNKKNKTGIAK
jgi:hypothetical protein